MTTAEILAAFPALRVLVVGDVCLDRWCTYDPALADPSRETGIARTAVVATEVTPGAAGTIANNLAALGAGRIDVLGMVGDDGFGYELRRALAARGISPDLLVNAPGIPTFTYTKLLNAATGEEDLPRVDFVYTRPLPEAVEREIVSRLDDARYDVILVSDQAETAQGGVVTNAVRDAVERIAAAQRETVVWVDSRLRAELFRNVVLKPNQQEAEAACRRLLGRIDYSGWRRAADLRALIVTHGAEGALVVDDAGERWSKSRHIEKPVDICGAGDSFSAGGALAFRVTRDALQSADFGNRVASVTVMKKGTGTASPAELC
ncbi:MAG TPA: PfkB family carbohydrate kinase [Candidatus Acidoferrales bacterium]|nr:PfkB family carbohydrate kinase [Candidatus Acidoferrales bacterium]